MNQAVEQIKASGWNNEQVHGGNVGRVVSQDCAAVAAGAAGAQRDMRGSTGNNDSFL